MTDRIPEEPWETTRTCPHCAGEMRPIVYGYPDRDLFDAGDRGDVFIGGCVIPQEPIPQWHCFSCGRDVYVPEVDTEA